MVWEGYEDGEHIVFHCEELWRPESKLSKGEDLDDKRWIVLVPKVGGMEGQMEEWDLVEEFFHRIQDPLNGDEEELEEED